MIVMGIDPGYAIVGYGVVSYEANRFTPVHFGAVTTPAGMDFPQRLGLIYDGILEIVEQYKPCAVSVEKLFFTNNQKTGIDVAQARGVVLLAAQKCGVDVFEYTPRQVKQAVVGYGLAEKAQVMEMTRMLLGLKTVPRPDDTADALAMAICHAHSAGSYLNLARMK